MAFDIYGNNDAFVDSAIIGAVWAGYGNSVFTADIDLHPTINFSYGYDGNGNITSVTATGSVTGDAFPDAEVFVRDSQGNGVMLGTYSNPPDASPFTSLPGNNGRPMITIPETTINVENGVFTGVTYQGNRYSIDDWNRRMGVGQSP